MELLMPNRAATSHPVLPLTSRSASLPAISSVKDLRILRCANVRSEMMTARKPRCKSGCITCKIRKIKCDETKPACLKCTSTMRKCDGYPTPASTKVDFARIKPDSRTASCTQLSSSSLTSTSSASELRALQYFQSRTTSALCSVFDSEYWVASVLRLSAFDPMIRNSVLAFSCMHEGFEIASHSKPSNNQLLVRRQLALHHYGIVTKQMQHHLGDVKPESPTLLLTACINLICLELLRDNYGAAIKHLEGGLHLISTFCSDQSNENSAGTTISLESTAAKPIAQLMVQALYLQDVSYDISLVPKMVAKGSSTRFRTVSEAKEHLEARCISAYHLLWEARKAASTTQKLASLHQVEMKALLEWRTAFSELLTKIGSVPSQKDLIGIEILNIHYYCLEYMLNRALPRYPLPAKSASFIRILDLIQNVLQPPKKKPCLLPKFSFDIGVIGPLFYTSIQAPDLKARNRAAKLLRHPNIPHREGMWASGMASMMSERILSLQAELMRAEHGVNSSDEIGSGIQSVQEMERLSPELGSTWFNLKDLVDDHRELKVSVGLMDEKSPFFLGSEALVHKEGLITWETW